MIYKKTNFTLVLLLAILSFKLQAQKMGVNNGSPQTTLDVNGSVAYREGTPLSILSISGNDVALGSYSFYRVTDAVAGFIFTGFASGQDGRVLVLINSTNFNMTLSHQSLLSVPANRILISNNNDLVIFPNGSITLTYSNTLNRWLVNAFLGASADAFNAWGLTGNTNTNAVNNFIGTTDAQPLVFKTNNTEGGRLTATGNWGIGTTAPANKLSVVGNASVSNHIAIGANSAIDNGSMIQSGSTFKNLISAQEEITGNQTVDYSEGLLSHLSINATNNSATEYYALDGIAEVKTGNTQNYASVVGSYTGANHKGTGTVNRLYGSAYYAQNKAGGTITDLRGIHVYPGNNSSGTVTNAYGIYTKGINNIGTGTVTNAYGLFVDATCNTGGGVVTNNYGILIEDHSAVGTNQYNLYSKGASSKNYFAGSISIGVASSNQQLEISQSFRFPSTSSSSIGVIYKDGNRFIHNYKPSANDGNNTFVGVNAGNFTMSSSTSWLASGNTGIGTNVLTSLTTGGYNTAIGHNALTANTTGNYNMAFGSLALAANISGSANTAVGHNTLASNTAGNNTAIGNAALYSNTTGSANTAIGESNLNKNNGGSFNTSVGQSTMRENLSGQFNVAMGVSALQNNLTGNNNIAIGVSALTSSTAGNDNVVVGYSAMSATTSSSNVAVGYSAGTGSTGANNTFIGYSAGTTNTTGTNNTLLGYNAEVSTTGLTNATAIGNGAIVDANNKVRIGNTAVTVIGGQVAWSNLSDRRMKKDITDNALGLNFIKNVRPVKYVLKSDSTNKIQDGFIAQEIEETMNKLGVSFSGLNKPQNDKDNYSVSYSTFVVPLVNAVKELDEKNARLQAELDKMKNENASLKSSVEKNNKDIETIKAMLDKKQN